jgi:hypothetical protein
MITKKIKESEPIECKPLEVTYLLSLPDWLVKLSFSFTWIYLVLQDFNE